MQTSDLVTVFDQFPRIRPYFKGVFPLDKIPVELEERNCVVFNRDTSVSPGSHWIALVRTFKNNYEIFDSLSTNFLEIKPYLNFENPIFHFNLGAFQESTSSTCGLFAAYFCIHRLECLDASYSELLEEIFVTNKSENEKKVLEFFTYFTK